MGEGKGKGQRFQDSWSRGCDGVMKSKDQWTAAMDEDLLLDNSVTNYHTHSSASPSPSPSISSTLEDSTISNGSSSSSSSLDTRDDASSSPQHSSFSNSTDSLFDLSELMSQLPIKRGLSKFYQGKSESFTCLSRVTSIDDLKKKIIPYRRKTKASKSYQAGLDTYKSFTLPKPTISKKTPRASLSSIFPSRRVSFNMGSNRPPQVPSQKDSRC